MSESGSGEQVILSRSEALDVLAALDAAAFLLRDTDLVTVLLEIHAAAALVTDRLWPGEGRL